MFRGRGGRVSAQPGASTLEALQVVHQANTLAVGKRTGVLPSLVLGPASPVQLVPAIAHKLVVACAVNGLMAVDEAVPNESTVCLRGGGGKPQTQHQCPPVGSLHHAGKGKDPSYKLIAELFYFHVPFTLRYHRFPAPLGQKPTDTSEMEAVTAASPCCSQPCVTLMPVSLVRQQARTEL